MLDRGVPLVALEPVARMGPGGRDHQPVPGHLGKYRGRGDDDAETVGPDDAHRARSIP